jgi:hypothetical protein
MRCRTPLFALAMLAAVVVAPALHAQELKYDAQSLDPAGAAPTPKAKADKNKKKTQQTPAPAAGVSVTKPAKPGGDRQFGELEGWSPGKTPPKPKDNDGPSAPTRGPVSVGPSGNVGVGLPF